MPIKYLVLQLKAKYHGKIKKTMEDEIARQTRFMIKVNNY